jgi:hypothetical protein
MKFTAYLQIDFAMEFYKEIYNKYAPSRQLTQNAPAKTGDLQMIENVAVDNLTEIKDVFDIIDVKFWLDHGTLLGAVRDGRIIEWDSDVDLGTWYYNTKKILSAFGEFKKRRFTAGLDCKRGNLGIRRGGCYVGVSLYRDRGNYAWTIPPVFLRGLNRVEKVLNWWIGASSSITYTAPEGKFLRRSGPFLSLVPLPLTQHLADITWSILVRRGCIIPLIVPKHYFEALSTIEFYGIEFNIPSDVEKYLEYRYGSSWRTPIKEWKYKDDGAMSAEIRLCDLIRVCVSR